MIILVIFALVPFVLGAAVQYTVCRFTRRLWWKWLPPLIAAILTALVAVGRYQVWSSKEVGPWTQLIFVPGLPAALLFLGFFAGWRIWRRLWKPRVIRDKFKR